MEDINKLIALLIAVKGYAKNIHYKVHGEAFYGKHLFADRIAGANDDDDEIIDGYIDLLKEVCILGHGFEPLSTEEYYNNSLELFPETSENDDQLNFANMLTLIIQTLDFIENLKDLSKGDENLIGAIAQDLQQNAGLLSLQVKE
jgi:DNA-binding ferritin-like protein